MQHLIKCQDLAAILNPVLLTEHGLHLLRFRVAHNSEGGVLGSIFGSAPYRLTTIFQGHYTGFQNLAHPA